MRSESQSKLELEKLRKLCETQEKRIAFLEGEVNRLKLGEKGVVQDASKTERKKDEGNRERLYAELLKQKNNEIHQL